MSLFKAQTPAEQYAHEQKMYAQKFRYAGAVVAGLGALLWAVQHNKKGKGWFVLGGLLAGGAVGMIGDFYANKKDAPVTQLATSTTETVNPAM